MPRYNSKAAINNKYRAHEPMSTSELSTTAYPVPQGINEKAQMKPRMETELRNDTEKSYSVSVRQYSGQTTAEMDSSENSLAQPRHTRYINLPRDHKITRASGLSAGSRGHYSNGSAQGIDPVAPFHDPEFDAICRICYQPYSWEDSMIWTSCCDCQVGSKCYKEYVYSDGCCMCGSDGINPEQVSHSDQEITDHNTEHLEEQLPGSMQVFKKWSSEEFKIESKPFLGLRGSLYDGSESADSELSEDEDPQNFTAKERRRQDAKQYIVEATEHLVQICDEFGGEVHDEDKYEVMERILNSLGGCHTFQTLIEKYIVRSPFQPTVQQTPVEASKPLVTTIPQPETVQVSCNKCEELEARMKKVENALLDW